MALFPSGVSFGTSAGGNSATTPATSGSSLLQGAKKLGSVALALNNNGGMPAAANAGVKATQPGGLSTGSTNTLASAYTAPATHQVATGNTTNTAGTAGPTQSSTSTTTNPVTGVPQPVSPTQPTGITPQTPVAQGLGGTTGALLASSQQGSPAAETYAGQTAQYGAGNIPIGQQAAQIAQQYGQQYSNVGQMSQQFQGGQLTTGTSPVAQGNAAVTAQTGANEQTAVAQGEQAALQGLGVQLTGQGQAATAANEAAGQSNTAQQLQQAGLTSAAQLQTPGVSTQQVGQGTTVLDANGQPVATTPTITGQGQTAYSVNPTTFQGGQPQTASGPYQTTSTPFQAGQVQGQAALGESYAQNNATISAAQGIQQKVAADITANNINPSSLNFVNNLTAWAKGQQLSDPNYANFFNDLSDYAGTIGPVIGMLGTQTDAKSYVAQQMVNGTASGSTVEQVLDNLNSLLLNKNESIYGAGQGGTPAGQNAGASTAGQVSAAGYGFTKNPTTGMWEVAS